MVRAQSSCARFSRQGSLEPAEGGKESCIISVNTPYDDVFRTLLNDCSALIIPLVNEIFHESYSGQEAVEFYPNEHFVNRQDGLELERVTDSCFGIRGEKLKEPLRISILAVMTLGMRTVPSPSESFS